MFHKPPRASRKVLIVDDVRAEREALAEILSCVGHVVLHAECGEDALTSARAHQPDLILVDVDMPDLDGFATTRRLKADPLTCDIPVVFVAGKHRKSGQAWSTMLGARGCVAKPYEAKEVLAQVEL